MDIKEVIKYNKDLQTRAHELNRRTGEEVFKVMGERQWREWLAERINGARSASEIPDMEKIKLPKIDEEIVRMIYEENPDQIEILGQLRAVEYPGVGYAPRIEILLEEVEAWELATRRPIWCGIPDDGYWLASGRQVELRIKRGHYAFVSGQNGKMVKEMILAKLNSDQYSLWPSSGRPEILIPELTEEEISLPEIQTAEYGRCVIFGTPLLAFGTIIFQRNGDRVLAVRWFQSRNEAEENRNGAMATLAQYQIDEREKWERTAAKAEATEARKKFSVLYEKYYYDRETPETIREKLSQGSRVCVADNSAEGNRQYAAKINAMVAEIEAELSEIARKKAEEAADLERAVAAGEVLVGFEAWHRRGGMSGNGDGWVIRADGSLRDHDSDTVPRHKADGTYHWDYVMGDELALKWSCGTMRDVAGASEFAVVKMPIGGLTEAQREAVRKIELNDIGTVENSFGLDPKAVERQTKLVAEAAGVFKRCPACGEQLVIDENAYFSLIGEYGMRICQDDQKVSRLLDYNKPFSEATEGREAQIVVSKRISNGVIEALAYEKWGGWNLNLRWRKFSEEEAANGLETEVTAQGDGSFSEAGDRYFRCACGRPTRLTKGNWKRYLTGEEMSLTCQGCYSSGVVKKEVEVSADEKTSGNGTLDLSRLKAAWGK